MHVTAYWLSTFIMDFVKLELITGMVIVVLPMFNFVFKTSHLTMLIYPIGLLPFTYATQFVFSSVGLA